MESNDKISQRLLVNLNYMLFGDISYADLGDGVYGLRSNHTIEEHQYQFESVIVVKLDSSFNPLEVLLASLEVYDISSDKDELVFELRGKICCDDIIGVIRSYIARFDEDEFKVRSIKKEEKGE